MESLLLLFIILILGILVIVVAMLIRAISRLSALEEAGLRNFESEMEHRIEMALPGDMQARFEDVLHRHEQYLDELLRTTTNSFDQKIHKTLDISIQNQLMAYQKVINEQQARMVKEMKDLSHSIATKKVTIGDESEKLSEEIKQQYRKRLENHFTELAWQYINETLSENIDLHSQKESIFKQLQQIQKQLKKDYSDVDKITK